MKIPQGQIPRFGAVIGTKKALSPQLIASIEAVAPGNINDPRIILSRVSQSAQPADVKQVLGALVDAGEPFVYLPNEDDNFEVFDKVLAALDVQA